MRVVETNATYSVPDTFADKFSKTWKDMLDKSKAGRLSLPLQKNTPGHVNVPYEIAQTYTLPAIEFVLGWILAGGMDPVSAGAEQYPIDDEDGLENLKSLVDKLGIGYLSTRINRDLKALRESEKLQEIAPLSALPSKGSPKKQRHCHNCLSDKYGPFAHKE